MVLLWTVPVVAATVGVAVVLSQLRRLEEITAELAVAVRRAKELRAPLAEVRHELARNRPLVDHVFGHWPEQTR